MRILKNKPYYRIKLFAGAKNFTLSQKQKNSKTLIEFTVPLNKKLFNKRILYKNLNYVISNMML